jgi:hypothetical protein
MNTIPRSVVAVVAGIAVFSLLLFGASVLGDALTGGGPEWINRSVGTQLAWLLWNVVSLVAAGYVAAAAAPRAPARHALVMGAVQAMFTLGAMMTVADTATPRWLWIAGILVMLPFAWVGAWLLRAQHGRRVEA